MDTLATYLMACITLALDHGLPGTFGFALGTVGPAFAVTGLWSVAVVLFGRE